MRSWGQGGTCENGVVVGSRVEMLEVKVLSCDDGDQSLLCSVHLLSHYTAKLTRYTARTNGVH
jgi:hypothetical protein